MKFNIATKLAFTLSLVLSFFSGVIFYFSQNQLDNYLFSAFLIFLISFAFLKFALQYYVSKQIKSIYNILNEGETKDSDKVTLSKVEQDALISQKEKKQNLNNLEKQNNYRKEFIGNLSHELKTPLFSIQGYVETLIDGGIYDEDINMAYLKKASYNIDRLSAIVDDVDTIARVESDVLNLEKSIFSINDLIKSCIENLELLADRNDVKVSLEDNERSFKVFADKEKINRVIVNLISNSIKYGKEDGQTIIKLAKESNRLIIEITDNGIGIREKQIPRLFERFYRVDSNRSREQGGSGLGLAIVKHIIEAHNEDITVKSTFGEGTSISFSLKLA